MSTPPGKNVTHHDRDPALVATEQNLRYVVHDEAWSMFWALDATYDVALKMKERIAGSRECRTVAMTPYAQNADVTPILVRVAAGTPGPSADPSVRAAMQRVRQQIAQAQAQAQPQVAAPTLPALPPVVLEGRTIQRQPQLVSVPPPAVIPPLLQPLPRDPAMPPAIAVAPPAPPMPPVVVEPGPKCDGCGKVVPADLPETDNLRLCDECKVQGEYEDRPLDEIV